MTSCPLSEELLVRYWSSDVSENELDAIETHLFDCTRCFTASSRVGAMVTALGGVVPPFGTPRDVELITARGVRCETNDFHPGVVKEAWLRPDKDLLVHRLLGDLSDVETVAIELVAPDGQRILSFDDVRFEPTSGSILVLCQRHFVEQFPPDVNVIVRRKHKAGHASTDRYTIHHRIG